MNISMMSIITFVEAILYKLFAPWYFRFLLAGQAELAEGAGAHAALGGESLLNIGHEVRDVAPETLDRFK